MIILSQDKDEIFNFDRIANIWINKEILEDKTNTYEIYADGEILGEYKTEQKAKDILQEIMRQYEFCNEEYYQSGYGYVKNMVYEMPED